MQILKLQGFVFKKKKPETVNQLSLSSTWLITFSTVQFIFNKIFSHELAVFSNQSALYHLNCNANITLTYMNTDLFTVLDYTTHASLNRLLMDKQREGVRSACCLLYLVSLNYWACCMLGEHSQIFFWHYSSTKVFCKLQTDFQTIHK